MAGRGVCEEGGRWGGGKWGGEEPDGGRGGIWQVAEGCEQVRCGNSAALVGGRGVTTGVARTVWRPLGGPVCRRRWRSWRPCRGVRRQAGVSDWVSRPLWQGRSAGGRERGQGGDVAAGGRTSVYWAWRPVDRRGGSPRAAPRPLPCRRVPFAGEPSAGADAADRLDCDRVCALTLLLPALVLPPRRLTRCALAGATVGVLRCCLAPVCVWCGWGTRGRWGGGVGVLGLLVGPTRTVSAGGGMARTCVRCSSPHVRLCFPVLVYSRAFALSTGVGAQPRLPRRATRRLASLGWPRRCPWRPPRRGGRSRRARRRCRADTAGKGGGG